MEHQHSPHWHFFRAGGFNQVVLKTADDLKVLRQLDQKLWASLACPVVNLALDQRMLSYMDVNNDGRIRAPELLDAIDWTLSRLADPDSLFHPTVITANSFSKSLAGEQLALATKRLLNVLNRPEEDAITLADTADLSVLFPADKANGDGLIPASFASDDDLKQAISDIIASVGSLTDRSGEPALSEELINDFFAELTAVLGWLNGEDKEKLHPFGNETPNAIAAISALKEKIEDYFTRVDMAAYDPRALAIMNGDEASLVRLAALNLADKSELESLPLAGLHNGDSLPLTQGINPAWKDAINTLLETAIKPVFGPLESLTRDQWKSLVNRSAQYFKWQADHPKAVALSKFSKERLQELADNNIQARLLQLVADDKAVEAAANGLVDLDKLLRYQHGLITMLRNFISFQDFYGREELAVFQAGRLFIDGKSCDLVVEVKDINAHSTIATKSNSFLVYCTCMRRGQPVNGKETMNIVAAITAGAHHELMVGRNGLFYDRNGNDWDATIVKVIENAISVREAFLSPYYRASNMISEQIQKLAASRDQTLMSNVAGKLNTPADAAKPFDIAKFAGIFAAIGLAVGALGTALAAMMSGLLALTWWQWPLVIIGIMLLISGPSMLMAWFKLRSRSLGPILDANGWAVNNQARISIAFGESLTQLATLPKGAVVTLNAHDQPKRGRKIIVFLLLAALAAGGCYYYVNLQQDEVVEVITEQVEPLPL